MSDFLIVINMQYSSSLGVYLKTLKPCRKCKSVLLRALDNTHTIRSSSFHIDSYPLVAVTNDTGSDQSDVKTDKLTGVTKILAQTKPIEEQLILERWKLKMIRQMGKEAFDEMQKETLATGHLLHKAIEDYLDGNSLESIAIDPKAEFLWESVQPVLKRVTDVKHIEGVVKHPDLGYYGYVDCIAEFDGRWCIIDWKTSKKKCTRLNQCYDNPIQISAYLGAYNIHNFDNQLSKGLIVKAYHDGQPASLIPMNDFTSKFYWNKWLTRLKQFHEKQSGSDDARLDSSN